MEQNSLFGQPLMAAACEVARFQPVFDQWQATTRALLQRQIAPELITWEASTQAPLLQPPAARVRVPKAFVSAAAAASCHRAADRWALLYRLLWRLSHGEAHVLALAGDPDVARLRRYRQAVLRDVHKFKAFLRFRQAPAVALGEAAAGLDLKPHQEPEEPAHFVAWFEPEHHIVEYTAPFFRRRFANMRWSILTPQRCAHWHGSGEVMFSAGVERDAAPTGDRFEAAWRTYYASIFNPARLKLKAMCAEMPKKYWHNLPEADLIGSLTKQASQRVAQMLEPPTANSQLRCGPRPPSPKQQLLAAAASAEHGSLQQLALQAATCERCSLAAQATQCVFGEGPVGARIMLLGEQPGDQEDLSGRPFVGPAGQLLNRAMQRAGLQRSAVYLTNTVKHFKYRPQGKRRLHETPNAQEVFACADWLQRELAVVDPELVVCLGATAARSQLGDNVQVTRDRGKVLAHKGRAILITAHPAQILRISDRPSARWAYAQLVADLKLASDWA